MVDVRTIRSQLSLNDGIDVLFCVQNMNFMNMTTASLEKQNLEKIFSIKNNSTLRVQEKHRERERKNVDGKRFRITLESPEWKIVQVDLNSCDTVEVFGRRVSHSSILSVCMLRCYTLPE